MTARKRLFGCALIVMASVTSGGCILPEPYVDAPRRGGVGRRDRRHRRDDARTWLRHYSTNEQVIYDDAQAMQLNPAVYDLWVFRRGPRSVEFLLLHTSQKKADRHFNGGRFWQIPSGMFQEGESVPAAFDRELAPYGLAARAIWAAEHTYTIYNRRFDEMQIISVFAVETGANEIVRLDLDQHAECEWLPYDAALERVSYRGLKDGLRSVHEYVTGVPDPAPELRLR